MTMTMITIPKKTPFVLLTLLLGMTLLLTGSGFVVPQQEPKPAQGPEKALDDVRSRLKGIKRTLAREGKYECCISPSCDFCAISVGSCPCSNNLSSGDPVCHECKGGWEVGYGVLDDVDPEEVNAPPKEMSKMMYDARAKKYLQRR